MGARLLFLATSAPMRGFPSLLALLGIVFFLAGAGIAAANPHTPYQEHDSGTGLLFSLFLYNLPVNMLWFTASLYATCRIFGERASSIAINPKRFFASIVAVVLIVTALGALIDFVLLIRSYGFVYEAYFDIVNWTSAAAIIFASIYFSTVAFLDPERVASLVPAVSMTVLNPLWWWFSFSGGSWVQMWTLWFSLLLLPVFLYLLLRWQEATHPPLRAF